MTFVLASFQGSGVLAATVIWLLLTILAFVFGIVGLLIRVLRRSGWRLPCACGATACLLVIAGVVLLWSAFLEARSHLGSRGDAFRPGFAIWVVSAAAIAVGLLAMILGVARRQAVRGNENRSAGP